MKIPKLAWLVLMISAAFIADAYAGEKIVIVVDRYDRPIPGARVVLFYPDEERFPEFRTNERGEAAVVLESNMLLEYIGVYVGEERQGVPPPTLKEGTTWPVTVRMENVPKKPPIIKTVIVVDRFNRPISGAKVYVSYVSAASYLFWTNERGEATVVVKPNADLHHIAVVVGEELHTVAPSGPDRTITSPLTVKMDLPKEPKKKVRSWSRAWDWFRAKRQEIQGK